MKINQNFGIVYILLVIAQMAISNYFRISPFIYVTVLPVIVLCIPLKINTVLAMVTAFATGLAVDFMAEGVAGLNALALVPVALVRHPILKMVIGAEVLDKNDRLNIRTTGPGKVLLATGLATALFLIIYILADGAGARPAWFNAVRFAASLACDTALALLVVHVMNPDVR